jgi:serine/threonine protein kinase
MGHNNANSDIIQAEVIHAELVQDIDARLKQQLKEKEDQLMRGFAKREAQLNAKEAELKSREAQNIRHASSTVTSYPASVTPSGASCDSSQSWIDFLSSPCFEKDEIRIGKNLVTGTFNAVFELKSIKLQPQATWCSHDERSHNRKLLADSSKKQKIVCKRLKPSLDPKKQRLAGKRLVYEARLLSKLGHENVISMIGLSAPETPATDFFFLMHQIQETLYHCISKTWNKRQRGKPKFILNQVTVATYIAAAIDYIHSLNIIFSDLKPEVSSFMS